MSGFQLNGHDLLRRGWPEGPAIGAALKAVAKAGKKGQTPIKIELTLKQILDDPTAYVDDPVWGETADRLTAPAPAGPFALRDEPAPLRVWGRELIDAGSLAQINDAARLPVTLRVALMPDAHVGYGIPIGGVAALDGAIAPYMVGVDIGCRMHATIFQRNPIHLDQMPETYRRALLSNTYFGRKGPPRDQRAAHPILDDPRWELLPRELRNLRDKAAEQLGTSGGGNHFVEFTRLTVLADNPLGVAPGKYIALVSHSGSRGMGFKFANHYSRLAEQVCAFLPAEVRRLAYFTFGTELAAEYELAMNLAGDYARANHEVIHRRIVAALGSEVAGVLQNHHNFAWRVDRPGANPVFIHRKGATPAERGVTGIIPGSMAAPGFFVTGLGDGPDRVLQHPSLNSAAHGSGRVMSRTQANKTLNVNNVRAELARRGVTLLGGGLDEAPDAYKDSRAVIAAQSDLVEVWAEFDPAIVRMAGDGSKRI